MHTLVHAHLPSAPAYPNIISSAIQDFITYINFTTMAVGLVGGELPNLVFYFPVLKQNFSSFGGSRCICTVVYDVYPCGNDAGVSE